VASAPAPELRERVVLALRGASCPVRQDALRQTLRVKTQRLVAVMRELLAESVITRSEAGWSLAAAPVVACVHSPAAALPLFPEGGQGDA
jgi:hypothetical protein